MWLVVERKKQTLSILILISRKAFKNDPDQPIQISRQNPTSTTSGSPEEFKLPYILLTCESLSREHMFFLQNIA